MFALTPSNRDPRAPRRRAGPAGALLLLAAALPAGAEPLPPEPIPWQDAAPMAVPFLQLPLESPATVGPGHLQLGLRTVYSNSIARTQSPELRVSYHLETIQPTLALRLGLGEGTELQLDVPAVAEVNPSLDATIKGVESWFHTENKLRRGSLSPQAGFQLVRPDGSGTSFTGPRGGIGDVWLGAKGRILQQAGWGPALAWRAAVKLPTGAFPFGSGVAEVGLGLLASADLGRMHLWAAADLMVPDGPVSRARLPTRPHPAFQLAVGRDLGSSVTLLLQGSTHGPALRYLHLSEIDGWTFYVLAGARVRPAPSLSVGMGLIENLFVTERGTDVAGMLDLSWRF